jgi:predicted RNA-binding protein associated with RNAse of E/G family
MLDVVVEPDLSRWRWKDEDHLAEAVEDGVFSPAEGKAIRREGERVIGLIEAGTPPFDAHWAAWRPDPAWPIPTLPAGWEVACSPPS